MGSEKGFLKQANCLQMLFSLLVNHPYSHCFRMSSSYTLPQVFAKAGGAQIDDNLALALLIWSLESEREKGGGFLRKKNAERVTQVSIQWP